MYTRFVGISFYHELLLRLLLYVGNYLSDSLCMSMTEYKCNCESTNLMFTILNIKITRWKILP